MTDDKKYLEINNTSDWEVLTDTGWSDIKSCNKTIEYEVFKLHTTGGLILECADNHIVFDEYFNEVFVVDLKIGQKIQTQHGLDTVSYCGSEEYDENMYDLTLNDKNHRFYTNGILSHNSLILGNLAHTISANGANVAVITLELSEKKYLRRIASNVLSIPINEYNDFILDRTKLQSKIDNYKVGSGVSLKIPGKLIIKEFPTSTMRVGDLEAYMQKLEEDTKIKFDVIIIDYINLMIDSRNPNSESSYTKVKNLAEDLRGFATRKEYAIISATQSNREGMNSQSVLTMDKVSESIGLPQTVDALFSINRSLIDIDNDTFTFGATALRDSEEMGETHEYKFNKKYLRIEEDINDMDSVHLSSEGLNLLT